MMTWPLKRSREPVCTSHLPLAVDVVLFVFYVLDIITPILFSLSWRIVAYVFDYDTEAKAKKDLSEKAKGKGPLNTGQQGIKKSGKK